MHAEVIAIGDELTSGQRLDTNSQWLSQQLGEIGIPVKFHTTVADDLEANVAVFRAAVDRADVVVATGGLGPTADDLTREALAQMLARPLVLDENALAHVFSIFARRGREMPERNRIQAMFPQGSRVIPNPEGTAPGIDLEVPRSGRQPCRLFALPGVPAEMFQMWRQSVAPALTAGKPLRVVRHKRIKCFGVGESHLEQMLPDLIRRGRDPSVGITVHEGTITLRITAVDQSAANCLERMRPTEETIRQCLGELVFGAEDDELEHAVISLLIQKGHTLATAEGGTGGLVARWLSQADQCHQAWLGGEIAATDAALKSLLAVPHGLLTQHTCVSAEVTAQMAQNCRERLDADFGLAISAFPKYDPGASTPAKFYMALADRQGVEVKAADYAAHSAILTPLSAKRTLNLLRLRLLGRT